MLAFITEQQPILLSREIKMEEPREGPRHKYSVRIPKNATQEEIDEFMKEFVARWNQKNKKTEESSEPASKPEQD